MFPSATLKVLKRIHYRPILLNLALLYIGKCCCVWGVQFSKSVQHSAMWLHKYWHEEYIGFRAQHMHGNMIRQQQIIPIRHSDKGVGHFSIVGKINLILTTRTTQ